MKKRWRWFAAAMALLMLAGTAAAETKTSSGWQDETMYFILTDRFLNGDQSNDRQTDTVNPSAYQGGDFQGIQEKLGYLQDLGITSIVISPVFQNEPGAYHGYRITDYSKFNPQFGTKADLAELVENAHKQNIKVIVDFPATRVSAEHVWLYDPAKSSWFTDEASSKELEWLGELAQLNTKNPEVQAALVQAAASLAEQTGIDGLFFSDASAADPDFWRAFDEALPDMHLIGEMNEEISLEQAAAYEQAGLDAVTSSWLQDLVRSQFVSTDELSEPAKKTVEQAMDTLQHPLAAVNRVDSVWTDRFTLDMASANRFPGTRWKMALAYLYTIPGTPALFYGTEIAQNGESGVEAHGLMNFRTDQELTEYIKQLAAIRAELPALRRGSFESLYEQNGMSVFKRQYKEETIVVAINNTDETQSITIPVKELDAEKELRGLFAGDLSRSADGEFTLILDRETAEIYALADRTGINYAFIAAMAAVWVIFILFLFIVWKRGRKASGQT